MVNADGLSQNNNYMDLNVLKKAAEEGDAEAQYRYAKMLVKGDGVPEDLSQAMAYYAKAARQAHSEAVEWCLGQAERGSPIMQYLLVSCPSNNLTKSFDFAEN